MFISKRSKTEYFVQQVQKKFCTNVVNSSVWEGEVEEVVLGGEGTVGVLWEGANRTMEGVGE